MRLVRYSFLLIVMGGLLGLGVAGIDNEKPDAAGKPRSGSALKARAEPRVFAGKKTDKEAETAVAESAERFVAAYNRHDVKAVAALFTTAAEFVSEDGTVIRGREAIERHFAAVFAAFPKAQLDLVVESVRLITSNVAIEEGRVSLAAGPGGATETSRYVAVHVNQDGQWLLARTRDFSAEAEPRPNHDRLQELEWLTGEWFQEDEDVLIATSCRWIDNRNYLLQEFTIRPGGHAPVTGSTRIGWDPLTRQIKSWTFDTDGGYSEALWTRGNDNWVLKSRGVTHRGSSFSGTSILRHLDAGTLSWESRDRVEGGTVVADRGPLKVKRRPPPAGED